MLQSVTNGQELGFSCRAPPNIRRELIGAEGCADERRMDLTRRETFGVCNWLAEQMELDFIAYTFRRLRPNTRRAETFRRKVVGRGTD